MSAISNVKIIQLKTSQIVMEREQLNVKLKDRIRNTVIWQSTRVTCIAKYVTKTK